MNKQNFRLLFDPYGMRRIYKLYRQALTPVAARYRLTGCEIDILLFLANNPQYDTAVSLVSIRRLVKSQVSISIETLVERGFLERWYADGNKKVIHLRILPDAAPAIKEGRVSQETFVQTVTQGVSLEEMEHAMRVLQKLTDNAERMEKGKGVGKCF